MTSTTCENSAGQPLEANLEEWASFTAGLHFRDDLVRMVRLRSEARRRAVQRQRADAAAATALLEPLSDTADEVEIRRDTAVLYASTVDRRRAVPQWELIGTLELHA